ncbi:MAG: aa3-type cytochrome c oxidase subunit IV [Rhodobacteraceae bacterium]|nr:aa3-type cytochrome c oxidase subunit IV [Paracoccaceae bacterium]
MADHKHGEMKIDDQEKIFMGFVNFIKWSVIAIIGVLLFLAIFAI